MKEDNNYLMISSIQHFVFCKKQWALIHLEQQWAENYFTVDGNIFHENAHKGGTERRMGKIVSRGMQVSSHEHRISGICDVVEFKESKNGIKIHGEELKYDVFPVEYKRGKQKESKADIYQLVAQALCLEEMLCCSISKGYLYYGETKRRFIVEFDSVIRNEVISTIKEMHSLYERGHTPNVKSSKACVSCSLRDMCLPKIKANASDYLRNIIEGAEL